MNKWFLSALASVCLAGQANAAFTSGNDFVFMQGTLQQVNATFVNSYNGQVLNLSGQFNVNSGTYDGLEGSDVLVGTDLNDVLLIDTGASQQSVQNIEGYSMTDGDDVIIFASSQFTMGDVTIALGRGSDVVWANAGNDEIFGFDGDDIIDGGLGNDEIYGEGDDDDIYGVLGKDTISGGTGFDELYLNGFTTADIAVSLIDSLFISQFEADNNVNATFDEGYLVEILGTSNSAVVSLDTENLVLENGSYSLSSLSAVPIPAAAWLFGSALLGIAGIRLKQK